MKQENIFSGRLKSKVAAVDSTGRQPDTLDKINNAVGEYLLPMQQNTLADGAELVGLIEGKILDSYHLNQSAIPTNGQVLWDTIRERLPQSVTTLILDGTSFMLMRAVRDRETWESVTSEIAFGWSHACRHNSPKTLLDETIVSRTGRCEEIHEVLKSNAWIVFLYVMQCRYRGFLL